MAEAESPGAPETAPTTPRGNRRKSRVGVVVSNKSDKTVVVAVTDFVRHPRYEKTIRQTRKLHAHDEGNEVNEGDTVRIQETRPRSKHKRWRVAEVLERAR